MHLRHLGLAAFVLLLAGTAGAAERRVGETFRDCPTCPEMVVISHGVFRMGSNLGDPDRPETPIRTITIANNFAMGRTEVTVGEFRRFMKATGHKISEGPCTAWVFNDQSPTPRTWDNPGLKRKIADDEPVVCVGWIDAKVYVKWLSDTTKQLYRLPSEAEWEYAARAGTTSTYVWGEDGQAACKDANVYDQSAATKWKTPEWGPAACDDKYPDLAPVGRFRANAFGLYDMIGNVWEWMEDCYSLNYPSEPVDGSAYLGGACELRSNRGGGWVTRADRQRPAWRGRDKELMKTSFFGFRVARDLRDGR
jgi:formylglycine-generating enzyme required for sulfatase activity